MAEENKKGLGEEENEDVEDQTEQEGSGADGADDGGENTKGAAGGKSGGATGKTFTQDQINRMMTREKNQGRAAVYKELGIDPKDTKMVNAFKAFVESQKTDEQKAAEKANADAAAQAESERRVAIAEAKAEAMLAGVQKQYVDDAVTIVMAKMSDNTDIQTLLGELKTKYPMWFDKSTEDEEDGKKAKTGQRGTGSTIKNNAGGNKKGKDGSNGKEASGLGARLAAQRRANNGKASFWGK